MFLLLQKSYSVWPEPSRSTRVMWHSFHALRRSSKRFYHPILWSGITHSLAWHHSLRWTFVNIFVVTAEVMCPTLTIRSTRVMWHSFHASRWLSKGFLGQLSPNLKHQIKCISNNNNLLFSACMMFNVVVVPISSGLVKTWPPQWVTKSFQIVIWRDRRNALLGQTQHDYWISNIICLFAACSLYKSICCYY